MKEVWILGPCSLESRELYFELGKKLDVVMDGRDWYYKASFDKANRSSIHGNRGLGLTNSIEIFKDFKQEFPHIKLTTDVHECHQLEKLQQYIDCIQIPAFLCRQTDLIVEASRIFPIVNIKKGQWVSPTNILKSLDKIKSTNQDTKAWICERGSQFGYDKLLVDFSSVKLLKQGFDKVLLDCTHSTQYQDADGHTSGDSGLAANYLVSSSIFGYSGVFAEIHLQPSKAISDSGCQIKFDDFEKALIRFDKVKDIFSHE